MAAFRFARPIAAISVALAIVMRPTPAHPAQGCDATSPDAKGFLATASETFTRLDGAKLQRLGWKSPPASVALVTQTAVCDAVVSAHNKWADGKYASYRVTRTPIAKAGTAYLLDLPAGHGPAERLIFIYDSAYRFTTVY
jgi:hypothetical protein